MEKVRQESGTLVIAVRAEKLRKDEKIFEKNRH